MAGDTINAPFEFFLDDFEKSVPARWDAATRWRYFRLLTHLWHYGPVPDDDYEIATAAGIRTVGKYAQAVAKLRVKLCPVDAGYKLSNDIETPLKRGLNHVETALKPPFTDFETGVLTQRRVHEARLIALANRQKSAERVEKHRKEKRQSADDVTRYSENCNDALLPSTSYPLPSKDSDRLESHSINMKGSTQNKHMAISEKSQPLPNLEIPPALDRRPALTEAPKVKPFDEWWSLYPRKVGKGAARKAYAKAIKHIDHTDLLAHTAAFAHSRETEDPQFTPHPATWLNQERYDDEPDPAQQPRKSALDQAFDIAFGKLDPGSTEGDTGIILDAEGPDTETTGPNDRPHLRAIEGGASRKR